MKRSRLISRAARSRWLVWSTAILVTFAPRMSSVLSAQSPPPVEGTIALEGTLKTVCRATNIVIVTTIDGLEVVYHFAKGLVVHGGKGAGVAALAALKEGSTVVVHYSVEGPEPLAHEIDRIGDEGLKVTEGMVTRIDRGRKQITIRFDNSKTEAFRLTDRAAAEAARDIGHPEPGATKVVIYYSDEAGHKVAHFFKRVS